MKFKALVPFAYADRIYDVNSSKTYEEDEKLVSQWIEAGYCEEDKETDNTPEMDEKAPESDEVPLDKLGYDELKKRAKAAGIEKYNSMKKDKLIEALRGE
jgi:hypothetical protein